MIEFGVSVIWVERIEEMINVVRTVCMIQTSHRKIRHPRGNLHVSPMRKNLKK